MNFESEIVYLNALAYIIVNLLLWRRFKRFNEVIFISLLWSFSAISSLYYYGTSYYHLFIKDSLNPFALVFYFICYILLLYPLLFFNSDTIKISLSEKQWKVLMFFIYISGFTCILPIYESLVELLKNGLFNLGSIYEDTNQTIMSGGVVKSYLSNWGGRFMWRIQSPMLFITPILFFMYLSYKNKKKWLLALLLLSSFCYTIFSIARGQRALVIFQLLFFIYLFLLFKNNLSQQIRKWVKIIFAILLLVLLTIFYYITISRTNIDKVDAFGNEVLFLFLSRYCGEHFFNFSAILFDINPAKWGEYAFMIFNSDKMSDFDFYLKIPNYLFYGSIGDLFKDFSYATPVLFMFVGVIIKNSNKQLLGNVIILFLWAIILLGGPFGLFYETVQGPLLAIFIALYFILKKI